MAMIPGIRTRWRLADRKREALLRRVKWRKAKPAGRRKSAPLRLMIKMWE